jgi:hypothetical protein
LLNFCFFFLYFLQLIVNFSYIIIIIYTILLANRIVTLLKTFINSSPLLLYKNRFLYIIFLTKYIYRSFFHSFNSWIIIIAIFFFFLIFAYIIIIFILRLIFFNFRFFFLLLNFTLFCLFISLATLFFSKWLIKCQDFTSFWFFLSLSFTNLTLPIHFFTRSNLAIFTPILLFFSFFLLLRRLAYTLIITIT